MTHLHDLSSEDTQLVHLHARPVGHRVRLSALSACHTWMRTTSLNGVLVMWHALYTPEPASHWLPVFTAPTHVAFAQLLAAIANNDKEVSPSMLYAAAAVLEGCSFVNGGSQNTMCGALLKLAEVRAVSVERLS